MWFLIILCLPEIICKLIYPLEVESQGYSFYFQILRSLFRIVLAYSDYLW